MNDWIDIEGYRFYSSGLEHNIYETKWHKGICYNLPDTTYDIFINKAGNWPRIIITQNKAELGEISPKDLPLNDGTIKLLSDCIRVEKINGLFK